MWSHSCSRKSKRLPLFRTYALDSGCHLRNHLLAGMKKAHLHGADRLKMGIKIPCQLSPAGLIRIFTCKGLPALSAELHLALVPEEVHL